ncbi:MAG: DUF1501 domain-containing protein [Planctomycetaceae bacterium]|nr:DUF1501 domain-containing protein [Planctomycetaceae bacterium]
MLSISESSPKLCDGVSRRALLQAGTLGSLGLLNGWPSTSQAFEVSSHPRTAKRCIVLFLLGGPPQHSTWDPKPLAPAEVRGEFGAIPTHIPGIQVSELLPLSATRMDRLALLRAVVTGDNAHSSSGYYMMTGQPHIPKNRENANPGAPNNWPTLGAVVQQLSSQSGLLPPAIRLPHHIFNTDGSVWPGQDSGWLGHNADPWLFQCEPATKKIDLPQFQLQADMTLGRMSHRRSLLEQLETQLRKSEQSSRHLRYTDQRQRAFDLLTTTKSREACDLSRESKVIRDRYGRSQFGQSVLLARRLVEADVEFVQVNWFRGPDEPRDAPCWDSHSNESRRLKTVLIPPFDQALNALLDDLENRSLLSETLVVCLAEFGRTPKFNKRAGRDHWGHVFSVALAGGGIRGGQVHGVPDEQATYPRDNVVYPEDITATIFHCLGYSPETTIQDAIARPHPISRGRVLHELLS